MEIPGRADDSGVLAESELRLWSIHMGVEGVVVGCFDGMRAGWVEFVIDRSGPIPVANPRRPGVCGKCGFDLASSVLDQPGGFTSGFVTAAEIHDAFSQVIRFQESAVAAIEAAVPGLRQLGMGLRDRVGMFTPTHHYAVLSALVQGRLSGVVETELFWSFGRWVSGELGCIDNNVWWPWQIASHAAPSWKDRSRDPGIGFLDLTRDESDSASTLLTDLVIRFCDFAEAWTVSTGVPNMAQAEASVGR